MDKVAAKLQSIISTGKQKAVATFERLEKEIPQDMLYPANKMQFVPKPGPTATTPNGDEIRMPDSLALQIDGADYTLHHHALGQVIAKSGVVGTRTIKNLLEQGEDWASGLAADLLTKVYSHSDGDKLMIRAVDYKVRGVLSSKYRRMNSGPIFEAFINAAQELGCVPTDSQHLDTKISLTMSIPELFDIVPTDPLGKMLFGASLAHSDYGDGALSMKFAFLRAWCSNLMMREEVLRKVHLGGRLSETAFYSETTVRLDTETQASAIKDLVTELLNPDKVRAEVELIKNASETEVNVTRILSSMQKRGLLGKAEAEEIGKVYNSADVELLPPGNSLWRASNAVSLFAQSVAPQRAFELQRLAGDLLDKAA